LIASAQYQEEEVINSIKNNNPFHIGRMERIAWAGDNSPAVNSGSTFDDLLRNYLQEDGNTYPPQGRLRPWIRMSWLGWSKTYRCR
jgi:hypothetical protein